MIREAVLCYWRRRRQKTLVRPIRGGMDGGQSRMGMHDPHEEDSSHHRCCGAPGGYSFMGRKDGICYQSNDPQQDVVSSIALGRRRTSSSKARRPASYMRSKGRGRGATWTREGNLVGSST